MAWFPFETLHWWSVSWAESARSDQGRIYVGAGGARAPRFTCCPQIQKLADRSDVICEVPKCSKMQIFRGSAPDPLGSLQRSPDLSPRPRSWREGAYAFMRHTYISC